MVGYDSIPPTPPLAATVVPPANLPRAYLRELRGQLVAQGFTEVYNYSFVTESDIRRFHGDPASHISVLNPIASELTHLRQSLLPGLFKNIVTNVRFFAAFRLFEAGSEIHSVDEAPHLAATLYNAQGDEQDFFELKRVLDCLFLGMQLKAAAARPYEHPVRSAEVYWKQEVIGRLFELHPALLQAEGMEGRAVFFDIDLTAAQRASAEGPAFRYMPPRKYPTSGFDLSVVADSKTPVEQIETELAQLTGANLVTLEFIRQYSGPPLPVGQKSVSYHLKLGAPDHTMTAEEVTGIRNNIIQGMQARGFELRGL